MVQVGVLIDLGAGILSEELGPEIGRRKISGLAQGEQPPWIKQLAVCEQSALPLARRE
jgi:hypothetical protein